MYKGEELAYQRMDTIIDDVLVIEVKSTVELHKGANRQIYNYLRATNLEVGMLLHFGPEPRFYRSYHSKTNRSAESVTSEESEQPFVREAGPGCDLDAVLDACPGRIRRRPKQPFDDHHVADGRLERHRHRTDPPHGLREAVRLHRVLIDCRKLDRLRARIAE